MVNCPQEVLPGPTTSPATAPITTPPSTPVGRGNAQREAAVRSLLVVVADADAQQHRLTRRRLVAHGVVERNFVRREAPCCIPGAAGRDLEGGSWVEWLTQIRKAKGDKSMPANPAAGSSGQGRRAGGTRVIWRKLDCLNPNLQSMQVPICRKDR